jgi:hypothetical protein
MEAKELGLRYSIEMRWDEMRDKEITVTRG